MKKINEKIELKSRTNYFPILVIILGGLSFSILGLTISINSNPDKFIFYLGFLFLLIGVYSIYQFYSFDIIEISKNELLLKNIFGKIKKKYNLSDFKKYTEIEKENAEIFKHGLTYLKWKDLIIYSNTDKYKISSTNYKNYDSIKDYLTKDLKRDNKAEKKWNRNNGLYFGIGGVFFGIIILGLVLSQDLTTIDSETWISIIFLLGLFFGQGIYLIIKNK